MYIHIYIYIHTYTHIERELPLVHMCISGRSREAIASVCACMYVCVYVHKELCEFTVSVWHYIVLFAVAERGDDLACVCVCMYACMYEIAANERALFGSPIPHICYHSYVHTYIHTYIQVTPVAYKTIVKGSNLKQQASPPKDWEAAWLAKQRVTTSEQVRHTYIHTYIHICHGWQNSE